MRTLCVQKLGVTLTFSYTFYSQRIEMTEKNEQSNTISKCKPKALVTPIQIGSFYLSHEIEPNQLQ